LISPGKIIIIHANLQVKSTRAIQIKTLKVQKKKDREPIAISFKRDPGISEALEDMY
jgi:hypothetical protein